MAMIVICEKGEPGAMRWTGNSGDREIYIRRVYEGCVVAEREANYYDDSDFYCTVWDEAAGEFKEFCFATTRAWTYPCMGTSIDAGPELAAKYQAHLAKQAAEYRARWAAIEAMQPKVGRRVKVIAGRKVKIGSEWWVVSADPDRYNRSAYRIGLRSDAGERAWTSSNNLEVVKPA